MVVQGHAGRGRAGVKRSKVAFRVDASLQIGSGHVMRCLTLADALQGQGMQCRFVCREHAGNLIDLIVDRGFVVDALPAGHPDFQAIHGSEVLPPHANWLGAEQHDDSAMTAAMLEKLRPDWLIVDHYALDQVWERALRPCCDRLMVIDDLADRRHDCDLLLDQNLGRSARDYSGLVPETCKVLVGTRYALLRPEFAELREYSLQRRQSPRLRHLLVSLGGVDQANATGNALDALRKCRLPEDCAITVVMGPHAPWLRAVQAQAGTMPQPCEVLVNVSAMAQLMADSDLAIGAAGSTAWERCTLGLPSVAVVLAENQRWVATALAQAGAANVILDVESIGMCIPRQLAAMRGEDLEQSSHTASVLCDGHGTSRVVAAVVGFECRVRPMCRDDLETVLGWRNHEEIRRFMYTAHEISFAEHCAWFERTSLDNRRHLLIVEEAGQPLGFVQFHEIGSGGVAEWGFYAAPIANPGFGSKLAGVALAHAFDQLGFHKICGEAIGFNERSMVLHRKLGFSEEGVLRDQHFDGSRHHSVHRFGLLANEWRAQH